ncbi:MAG: xylulokinase [Acidobacteriota bacterium]
MNHYLGVDIGTTGSRAVLIDETGKVLGGRSADHEPISTPQPQWAEQNPENWWLAARQAIGAVLQATGIHGESVKGIGLSGQMHGLVLLDKNSQVIRPSIIWCDQRCQAQADQITSTVGYDRLIDVTCNPALTGFTAPKLLWVREHEPEAYRRIQKVLLPKDYIRFRLTGEFAAEVSDASGTTLFDVIRRRWSQDIMTALELDPTWFPTVRESVEVSGQLTAAVASELGLKAGTPVVGGGGDQASGGTGNGIVAPGIVSSTIGTSGVVFAFVDKPARDQKGRVHTFCHAVPQQWHVMGVTQGAGLSLRWFRDHFGGPELSLASWLKRDAYEYLTEQAAQARPGCEGLIFLPYLMGERTPHLDANARGVFFGLTARHTRADMVRAVLEGVAYSLKDSFEIFREMQVPVKQVRASGGGGRSALWRQIQADIFDTEICTVAADEGAAFGAAILAAVGTGAFDSVQEACNQAIQLTNFTSPNPANRRRYRDYYEIYRSLYGTLKSSFDRVTEVVRGDR